MSRRVVWWSFWLGTIAALVILTIMSIKLVVFEERHQHDLAEGERQRRVDLALWRMESQLGPIFAAENTRPYFHYRHQFPLHEPHRLYLPQAVVGSHGRLQVSPLAEAAPPFVKRHFEVGPQQQFSCVTPVVPGQGISVASFTAENQQALLACAPVAMPQDVSASWGALEEAAGRAPQVAREWQIRSQTRQQQAIAQKTGSGGLVQDVRIIEGVMAPAWIGGELTYVRQVNIAGAVWLQGVVLDWQALETHLLDAVRELLPNAKLDPRKRDDNAGRENRLAGLPVRLLPGPSVVVTDAPDGSLWSWLAFAWNWCPILLPVWAGGVVLIVAVGLLLRQMLALDERRGAFVSAVTHELRTPLTTFRMYVEMQRAGMMQAPGKLDECMAVLDQESERLVHLVENVLAYAKLDQGRASARLCDCTVEEVLNEVGPQLQSHVDRLGITMAIDNQAPAAALRTDPGAIGQILFNLVDNAGKYGRSEHHPEILLQIAASGSELVFAVIDYGPGVPPEFQRRLFEAFSRAGDAASGESPGVGLGLALCARLAQSLGGDLAYDNSGDGACFRLKLPLVTKV